MSTTHILINCKKHLIIVKVLVFQSLILTIARYKIPYLYIICVKLKKENLTRQIPKTVNKTSLSESQTNENKKQCT